MGLIFPGGHKSTRSSLKKKFMRGRRQRGKSRLREGRSKSAFGGGGGELNEKKKCGGLRRREGKKPTKGKYN